MRASEAKREPSTPSRGSVALAARTGDAPSLLGRAKSLAWLESVAVVAAAALATLYAEWPIIADPLTFQVDALIHEFWMRRFQDPALLNDPLTEALLATGYAPSGFIFLHWLASHVADPVAVAELLPLVLVPLSAWLVFRIVRDHSAWRPAAWVAAALFVLPWDIHRFSGGHPRAFAQPLVLLAVLLLLRRRHTAAAAVPIVGVLLYPPSGLVALVIVLLAALELRPPRVRPRAAVWGAVSAAGVAAATLGPRLASGHAPELITAAQARRYPEFGPGGQMEFFEPSLLKYLTDNYSGFNLQAPGSILVLAAVVLLVVRPRNSMLLRWPVWSLPIASLTLFTAAHAVLFHLYLPHRYTYPLLPFSCIAIAVALRPTMEALAARARLVVLPVAVSVPLALAFVAVAVFPLGPRRSPADVFSWLEAGSTYLAVGLAAGLALGALAWMRAARQSGARPVAAAAALVAGAILVAEVGFAGGGRSPGVQACGKKGLYAYLGTLPKDAIVAGDPVVVNCIPIAARRPVVISRKLYQPWEMSYFSTIRERMFDTIRGYYGPSVDALVRLRTRYGADYVVVQTRLPDRPRRGMAPFTGEMLRLLKTVDTPAVRRLPAACATWRGPGLDVYSLACVEAERGR